MVLNIKDPEAHELARRLTQETGETLTLAVIEALRERLDRLERVRRAASAEELLDIGRRCAEGLQGRAVAHGAMLYDDRGLPR